MLLWWLWCGRCVTHACLSMHVHYAANKNEPVPVHWSLPLDRPAGTPVRLFSPKAGSRRPQVQNITQPQRKKIARHAHLTPLSVGGRGAIFLSLFFGKNVTPQNGLLIFLWKETHSETKSWKSSMILRVKPNFFIFLSFFVIFSIFSVLSLSSFFSFFGGDFHFFIFFHFSFFFIFFFKLFFIFSFFQFSLSVTFFHFLSFSFIFFHFLSFSFIFFHFLSFSFIFLYRSRAELLALPRAM